MPAAARWVRLRPCYSSPHPGGLEDAMKLPARVTICEVGTRDGFQIEPDFIPTEQKVEVVNLLSNAGVPRIEVTSFVHPTVVPQLRDAEQVMARIARRPGTRYAALVPNDKGAVRALDAGVDAIHTVVSASESHNLANVNMTIAESMEKLRAVMQVAERAKVAVACGISTSFGCPFEGDVPLAQLESVVRRLTDMGARAGCRRSSAARSPVRSSRRESRRGATRCPTPSRVASRLPARDEAGAPDAGADGPRHHLLAHPERGAGQGTRAAPAARPPPAHARDRARVLARLLGDPDRRLDAAARTADVHRGEPVPGVPGARERRRGRPGPAGESGRRRRAAGDPAAARPLRLRLHRRRERRLSRLPPTARAQARARRGDRRRQHGHRAPRGGALSRVRPDRRSLR